MSQCPFDIKSQRLNFYVQGLSDALTRSRDVSVVLSTAQGELDRFFRQVDNFSHKNQTLFQWAGSALVLEKNRTIYGFGLISFGVQFSTPCSNLILKVLIRYFQERV
jgi:hypothetical protein